MTVSYSQSIATLSYGAFARLLLRWRGSIYKLVWRDLVIFCSLYAFVALIYQFIPSNTAYYRSVKQQFIQICIFAGHISNAIPISFFLGFFVNLIVNRWWQQFKNLATPDSVCMLLGAFLGNPPKQNSKADEKRPIIFRRMISRYLNLSSALCFCSISSSMKKRFPTPSTLVTSNLMTEQEWNIYTKLDEVTNPFYVPLVWSISLITKAHKEKMILHDRHMDAILREVVNFWQKLQALFLYDYVNVPLVYNQVVSLAVYLYFAVCILSHQFTDPHLLLENAVLEANGNFTNGTVPTSSMLMQKSVLDVAPNIPIFPILSFIFYDGWLKVAEVHVLPFGSDDDDFDVVPLLERNVNTGMFFVDTIANNPDLLPELVGNGCVTDTDNINKIFHNAFATSNQAAAMGNAFQSAGDTQEADQMSHEFGKETYPPELPYPENLKGNLSMMGSLALICNEDHTNRYELFGSSVNESFASGQSVPQSPRPSWFNSIGNIFGLHSRRHSSKTHFRRPTISSLADEDHPLDAIPNADKTTTNE